MGERIRVFPPTMDAMHQRVKYIETRLQENTVGLAGMEKDGDMIDDSSMLKLHTEREILQSQLNQLQGYLRGNIEIVNNSLSDDRPVSIGHRVELEIEYSSHGKEIVAVTIGSFLDSKYLELQGGLLPDESVLISNDSPLGKSLLNKRTGGDVKYQSPNGESKAKIISVRSSPLLSR